MSALFLGTISVAVGLPWLLSLRKSTHPFSKFISILLFAHSLFGLYTLLVKAPPNIFSSLHLPFNTPTDVLRAKLLRLSSAPELNAELEDLLGRLASFETRSLYPRFGHNVLATCTYCRSMGDFALYALPRAVLSYIREIALVWFIASHRRKLGVLTLILMGVGEAYVLATVNIQVPQREVVQLVVMWHDILLTIRRIVFIVLPILIHFVPPPSFRIPFIYDPPPPGQTGPIDTTAVLLQTQQSLAHLLPALHLLKYAQAAMMRVPAIRANSATWWEEEARTGSLIRGDGIFMGEGAVNVRSVARGLDLAFDEARDGREEGKLLKNSKDAVRALFNDGIKVSAHWSPPTS